MLEDLRRAAFSSGGRLSRRQRLAVTYVLTVTTILVFYSFVYQYGMRTLEDRPVRLIHAMQIVAETMTTTGYGSDSPWETFPMTAYVIWMQISGILFGFTALRFLIIPLWKRTPIDLEARLTPKDDHVVIAGYRRDSDVLLDELERLGIGYVLIDPDHEEAKRLSDDGYQVIAGDPDDEGVLERASIGAADLLIADAGDRNASILLSAREYNPDLRVVCFTESSDRQPALLELGADEVFTPHAVVGQRLAQMAAAPFAVGSAEDRGPGPGIAPGTIRLGDEGVVSELLVRRTSPIRGKRLGETSVGSHPELEVVAGWFAGELRVPPDLSETLTPNTVLVVAGPERAVADVREDVAGVSRSREVVVAGTGEGGRAAVEALPDDVGVTTIDAENRPGVDVVGDVTDPETLRSAGLEDATALVLAVGDDATALLSIAVARSIADDVDVFARVTSADKVNNAFVAGADYVLSVQQVSARLLASDVYGERVLLPAGQLRTVRVDPSPFVGQTLGEARAASEDGCALVGVVRGGEFRSGDDVAVEDGHTLVVVGPDEEIQQFLRTH